MILLYKREAATDMNLKERIEKGMIFYEYGHTDPEDIAQERELDEKRRHCKNVMFEYNHTPPSEGRKRLRLLQELLGKCGNDVFIEDGVHMSYGCNLYLEGSFYANFNLSVIDDAKIYIGEETLIGPNVTLCTTGHPAYPEYREMCAHYSLPIKIGRNVWIGANSVVLPGVSIGDNSVIGAGSVVTRDIPKNVVAFGSPCRVAREIGDRDREYYFRDLKADFPYTLRK
jgi:galactoside O-acetyltransferase